MAIHAPITGAQSRATPYQRPLIVLTRDDLNAKFAAGIEADACLIEIRLALAEFRNRHGIDPRSFHTAGGAA